MDPYSFNINTANEHRLRRHIRDILLPYARAHLTSDHVAFIEKVVEELLLQTLEYVPMVDATSFLLPTEPFEILTRLLDSLDTSLPEEQWAISREHFRYLKTFFPPPPHSRELPTEKCWYEDDHYVKLSLKCHPISSPILSNRARRETPKLGGKKSRASIPRTKSALTTYLDPKFVSVETTEDVPAPPADLVLDLCLKLNTTSGTSVRPFLQAVLVPPIRKKSIDSFGDTPNVFDFLTRESPPRCFPNPDSPPLFPRVARGHSIHRASRGDANSSIGHATRISDLASMLPVALPEVIDGEDGDIYSHHMEVVSGHATLTFSSPPPPPRHSSDGSEVDELWNMSPPGTPATSLTAGKMDEIMIPRIHKFGHKKILVHESTDDGGSAGLLTATKSPGFFITSFISAPIPMTQTSRPIKSQLEGIKSGMHSPRPLSPGQSTLHSLLVQPPSALEERANEKTPTGLVDCVEDFEEQQFDDIVASLYSSTPQDPFFYIKEEKLDEKDIILMDVPNLPPPIAHPKEPALSPKGMQSFVAPKGEPGLDTVGCGNNGFGSTAFLTPVKGITHLALDLSWRPFNFGENVPTDEEIAEIAKPIQPQHEAPGYPDENYEKTVTVLLDLGIAPMSAEDTRPTLIPKVPNECEEFGMSPAPRRTEETRYVDYLLTHRERMKASGAKVTLEAEVKVQHDPDAEQSTAFWPHDDGYGDILNQSLLQYQEHHDTPNPCDPMEYCHRSRIDHGYSFDDSGIGIIDDTLGQFSASEFGVPPLFRPLQDDLGYVINTPEASKENIDDGSENKENVPPRDVNGYQPAEHESDPLASQYDWNDCLKFPESETSFFEPLSLGSQHQSVGHSDDFTNSGQGVAPLTPSTQRVELPEVNLISASEREQTDSRLTKRRKLDDLVPATSKDLFSTFIGLRNQATSGTLEHSETRSDTPTPHQTLDVPEPVPPRATPNDVYDEHTVRLPERWIPTTMVHRYLASMTLIQKRAFVHALQGHHCRVVLVERYDLGGTDIIIDPHYSVLFIPLLALPAHLELTIERISGESWRYSNILIVFEAFPSARCYKAGSSQDSRPTPYAYTPPICKAIKKLRRNLGIAEGCGTMNPRCTIKWAFANDVEEVAKFVRCFGEEAHAISTERGYGMLWDEREWLEEEGREGEVDLARVDGMNTFAAFLMLYDRSLETILDLPPEVRLADYGQLVGLERVARLNEIIESGLQQVAPAAESVTDHGY